MTPPRLPTLEDLEQFTEPQQTALVRLHARYWTRNMAADGLEHDPRMLFARWLVEHGRLSEDCPDVHLDVRSEATP